MTVKERLAKHRRRERARRRRARPGTQLELGLPERSGWGGRREGSGRKSSERPRTRHRARERFTRHQPVHVTARFLPLIPDLTSPPAFELLLEALANAGRRPDAQFVAFSVQGDHVHLIAEANSPPALARAVTVLFGRFARHLNEILERRGPVLDGRYHTHVLRSPAEVRRALLYLAGNAAHHATRAGRTTPRVFRDPFTSLGRIPLRAHRSLGDRAVAPVVTPEPWSWLLRAGWHLA